MLSGNLAQNMRTDTKGLSARVYQNGVWGFSSAAEVSQESLNAVQKAASANAAFMDRHIKNEPSRLPPVSPACRKEEKAGSDLPQKYYIDCVSALDAYIQKKYPGLSGRDVMAYADSMEKYLFTSDGSQAHFILPRAYIYVNMTADSTAGVPVELTKYMGGKGSFDEHFTDPALLYPAIDALYEDLMKKREGVYADAGYKTCILGGDLAGMLAHEAVGHTVEADLVLGGSVAAHNLNKMVASELVSMTDFAHTAFGERAPLPVYVDDEGVEAVDAPLIRDGVLLGYMHNRQSAQHFGAIPAGNARAYLFSDEPLIRMRNTAIHPGASRLPDMIASVEDGYYLLASSNGQADTTSEFMFSVNMGYEIKQGKLGRALLDTTVSGVAFDMLKTVDMVSDGMNWCCAGMCGKKQPMPVGMGGPELRCKIMIGGR